jgi:hypothetical protein
MKSTKLRRAWLLGIAIAAAGFVAEAADWKMAPAPIKTRWAVQVAPDKVLPEYPRPQLVRRQWTNLNGLWDFAMGPYDAPPDATNYNRQILVPFPVESALSGIKEAVSSTNRLFYRRRVAVKKPADGGRIVLNFGAVDWRTVVWVNGKKVGSHNGGYDAFSFDITDALAGDGEQEIVAGVADPTDSGTQPRGKQSSNPAGIWYTAVSGIWQTVWLEQLPPVYIKSLKITPDAEKQEVSIEVEPSDSSQTLLVEAHVTGVHTQTETQPLDLDGHGIIDGPIMILLPEKRLWSPREPWLYDVKVSLVGRDGPLDEVTSYFGVRKVSVEPDRNGYQRIFLNGAPIFGWGTLDQGWWPDGLYTAPTDEALQYDIQVEKALGFNLVRKHVKVEPARWYYHCDQMGMLVWQDMPNGNLEDGSTNSLKIGPLQPDARRDTNSAAEFEAELKAMIDGRRFFPSVIAWVVFNEGWGQYDTERLTAWVKTNDPGRLVLDAAGWVDRGAGDLCDAHIYPGPGMRPAEGKRASVMGEFGGLGFPVPGHLWIERTNWGYRTCSNYFDLRSQFRALARNARPMMNRGLAAAIYTQATDVETEVNGLMTYDRELTKVIPDDARLIAAEWAGEPAPIRWLVPDSQKSLQMWTYWLDEPPRRWTAPNFNDADWFRGYAPFATTNNANFPSGTLLRDPQIWMRRSFTLEELPRGAALDVLMGGNTKVYLNGSLVAHYDWDHARHYGEINISEYVQLFHSGKNTLAVEFQATHQDDKRVDVGLYVW